MADELKQIQEYPRKPAVEDDDMFLIQRGGTTYSLPGSALKSPASRVLYDNASTGMEAENVQAAIDELFTSGSEGKSMVASAITAKGVDTAADASFQTMSNNILAIPTENLPDSVHTIAISAAPPEGGTVSGGGTASEGMTVTVSAEPSSENAYDFGGWKENETVVSEDADYTFQVSADRDLTALFLKRPEAGVEWLEGNLPKSSSAYSFAYGGGIFVATSTSHYPLYSVDGKTWETAADPSTLLRGNFSIAYGNGMFVAVGLNSYYAAYSLDGKEWTQTLMPSKAAWSYLTYGNGVFVVIDKQDGDAVSDKCAYSLDGKTWTAATMPSKWHWGKIAFGNGTFVILPSRIDNGAAYSLDGQTWTAATLPYSADWSSVSYGGGKFVAVATASDKAAYSLDGQTWTAATMPSGGMWDNVTYGNGVFVSTSNVNFMDKSDKAAYSLDGQTWTAATMPSPQQWESIIYGDDKFVAIAYASNRAAYSRDGKSWTETILPLTTGWKSICYGDGTFVAAAANADKSAYSSANAPAV